MPCRISCDVAEVTLKRTPGCLARKGVVSAATMLSAVRDDGNPHEPGQTALERPDLLPHRPGIADDPLGPFQYPLAFRRQAMETRAAIDEQHAERLFELLDAGGESRLGDAAGFGSAAEALLAGDGDEKFQLIDQGATLAKADRSWGPTAASRLAPLRTATQDAFQTARGRKAGMSWPRRA